ncbi:MAG: type II toxin-antitoxin system RelE/ParE family toxin [Acidobacteriaceae bacterium]
MKYVIRSGARRDILRQYEYYLVEKDAGPAAERFVAAANAAMEEICKHPGIGAPKRLSNPALKGLRSLPVKGFPEIRIYYLVSAGAVRVVRVLHGKRDIGPLLEASGR